MLARQILCPECGTLLDVPPGKADCFVRCGNCQHRFRLPRRIAVTDDAIASWLGEGLSEVEKIHAAERQLKEHEKAASSDRTAVLPAISNAIRLVKSDASGALFEFPGSRLSETAFRCAMPRRCLRCGGRNNLQAHVIIYSAHLVSASYEESEAISGELVVKDEAVSRLSNEDMLARLPNVPNVPKPADQPMPYWLCDMCSSRGLISGQIRTSSKGVGLCRLWIGNLRRAEEFLVAAGGDDAPGHAELRHRIAATVDNPWQVLSTAAQNRLQQWYRPQPGEHFIAYIPDCDRARSEEGLAGIVVTNRRVVYHTLSRHKEVTLGEKLELQEEVDRGRQLVQMKCPSWDVKHVAIGRDGLVKLKNALTQARFRAIWH